MTFNIEKEIEQEKKILANRFTARQVKALAVIAVAGFILFKLLSSYITTYIIIMAPIVYFGYCYGWRVKDGLRYEDWLAQNVKIKFFKNETRCYRTLNKYVGVANATKKYEKKSAKKTTKLKSID